MLWAIGGRPRLLVPSQLWSTIGQEERTALLIHELAHLKRRDHWVRWLELIVAGLYWWNPAVWLIRRALREAVRIRTPLRLSLTTGGNLRRSD